MNANVLNPNNYKSSSAGTNIASSENDVSIQEKYSSIGWFMITWFGTTQNPYYIGFTCKKTGELFEEFTDKKDIEYFMLYRVK